MIRLRRKSSRGRNHDSSIITSDFFNTIDPERLFATAIAALRKAWAVIRSFQVKARTATLLIRL